MNFQGKIHLTSLRCLIIPWNSLFIPRKRNYIMKGSRQLLTGSCLKLLDIPWGLWDICRGQEGGHRSWRWPVLLWLPEGPQGTTQGMSQGVGSGMNSLTFGFLHQGWWIFTQTQYHQQPHWAHCLNKDKKCACYNSMNFRQPSPTPVPVPKGSIECEVQGLLPGWITTEAHMSVPYKFPSHLKHHPSSGRVLKSGRGIQGKGCRDMRLGSGEGWQWARKGLKGPLVHPKTSLPSSTPLYSFHALFIYYCHFFPSFIVAEYKRRKNMQLEYTNRIYH